MKNPLSMILSTLVLIILGTTGYSYPTYTGYSGAPGSKGSCSLSCHGTIGGTIEISGFPAEYLPGQAYSIIVSHNGGNAIKQFNGSCRISSGSENAGVIVAGTNTGVYSATGESNGVHLSSIDLNTGTFSWTAPLEGTGEVRLYIAGHQGAYSGNNTELVLVATEIVTDIQDESRQGIPDKFTLDNNYPNPFNGKTVIPYSLPELTDVEVEIFDISGRIVEKIIQKSQQSGYHYIIWNGEGEPSGVYFYRFKAGRYTATKKMIYLK